MRILVTGGAGYIGSHTCVELIEAGYEIVIADNLSNSSIDAVHRTEKIVGQKIPFHQINVAIEEELEKVFLENKFDAIIHFAGLKAVGESVYKPIEYYFNNLNCTMQLCKMMKKYGVNQIVFSSSATVYGDNEVPFTEDMMLLPTTNPYGETKVMGERILSDFAKANSEMSVTFLRYFNPIGAHESGFIGENPKGIPNNLMPYISQVASGRLKELSVFGNDYPTIDGTGVRDYIHVADLAKGHAKAIEKMRNKCGTHIFNLGTGHGVSVLELIHNFEKVNHIEVPYKIVGRRDGDIAECYANVDKAKKELEWVVEKTIEDMCRDTWKWEINVRNYK